MIGQTISRYKVIGQLGEGGMGVVYEAEDTQLERTVALKFLAAHLLNDKEAKARFLREAKAAAGLHHPNICPVFEIGETDGRTYLSMACIEGEPLEVRIEKGPLPLKEALDIGRQIAEGLEAAHEKGVVHRDIKPANVMVDAKGHATIMDFGLARLAEASRLTRDDQAMGTAAYMSPEQAQGIEVDNRTDIWSLGVVLYEMVRGQRPFQGEYDQALLFEICNQEPEPLTGVRAGVPMELEFIVGKCLAKDREDRYGHASEVAKDLRTMSDKLKSGRSTIMPAVSSMTGVGLTQTPERAGPLAKYRVIEDIQESDDTVKYLAEDTELHRSVAIRVLPQSSADQIERGQRRRQNLLVAATALAVLAALTLAFFPMFAPAPVAEARLRKFILPTNSEPSRPRISPNGRHVAYLTGPDLSRTLWVQDLDQTEPRPIVGPEAIRDTSFDWSPDSRFIAFRGEDELKKASVAGGPVVSLCEIVGGFPGIAWTPDGDSIIFTSRNRFFEVPARGGEPELFLEAEAQEEGQAVLGPAFATTDEGAVALLYVQGTTTADAQIVAFDPSTGRREPLLAGGLPRFAPSGHLIYDRLNPRGIWAVPFSVDMMKTTGEPFPISDNSTLPSVSLDGTLVYLEVPAGTGLERLVWRDRKGNVLGSIGQPQAEIRQPALSPDGKRVAVVGRGEGERDIWIHDADRPIKTRLTTHEGPDFWPTWSPTGARLAFASGRTGGRDLYLQEGDGSREAIPLLQTEGTNEYPTDWSRDGSILLFFRQPTGSGGTGFDIFYLRDQGNGNYEEVAFLTTSFDEITPRLSPDERFVAYVSNESGAKEVYLQAFPDGGNRRRVSVNGGSAPQWHADGSELFYVEGETLMTVPVSTSPTLTVGSPEVLFSASGLTFNQGIAHGYDVTPEGDKFVTREIIEANGEAQPVIRIVENWYEEFREREQD